MKQILIILFLLANLVATATDYYVATNGNDNNPGTFSSPFASWQKAFDVVKAGDIVYIRGGTYYFSDDSKIVGAGAWNKDGTIDNPIRIYAYHGEIPILDVSNFRNYNDYSVGIYLNNCHYWHLKGLSVRGAKQYVGSAIGYGVQLSKGGNIRLEEIKSYDNGGTGISVTGATDTISFINCDSYNNYDPFSTIPGGNADGFGASSIQDRETIVKISGCRSWNNSDDGFDFWRCEGSVLIDSCWSFLNGHDEGDGVGFKLGRTDAIALETPQRMIKNCIANRNKVGFSQNFANVKMNIYSNISYANSKSGFYFHTDDIGIEGIIIRNNISYGNTLSDLFDAKINHEHNSWNNGITISDNDFVSLDETQLKRPRKADGALPDIEFLHLAAGSELIDDGIYVGMPYNGKAPDLGPFESQSLTDAPIPKYLGSAIENGAPSVIELSYDLTLSNIIPHVSAFTVKVNSVTRVINSVTISGTRVLLTLASVVLFGDAITIAYTKPSTNPLQTPVGGQAVSISAQNVTNKVAAPAAPVFVNAVIEDAIPSRLEMIYSLSLANIVPPTSAFAVRVNSSARTVSSVTVSGTKVRLTLASPVVHGDIVTVSYTKPSTNPLQTAAGGQAASISAKSVTNKVAPPAVPVFASASIEDAAPSRIEILYNLALANIVPPASSFSVKVKSVSRTVSSVSISDRTVLLTLVSPVLHGDIVTVAYTKPLNNPLQTAAGVEAASFPARNVTNRVAVVNVAPVIVVTYPEKSYSGFVNEINAGGSFDDNKDPLTYTWSASDNIPLSSSTGAAIKFLGPIVSEPAIVEFTVRVSDGKEARTKVIPVEILPYKPDLEEAEILSVEASSHKSPDNPQNAVDENMSTMWSANGIDQWLIVELKDLFSIQHVKIAFLPDQKSESYFEILGSDNMESWKSMLTKSSSCGFSGNTQVFDFPPSKAAGKEFRYVKLVGLGNSADTWNYISELKIFGYRHPNPFFYEDLPAKLFPNPARDVLNIRIDEPNLAPNFIRIVNLAGKIMANLEVSPEIREHQISLNLRSGVYIVQLGSDNLILFAQKLIISTN